MATEPTTLPDEEVDVRKLIGQCEKNLNLVKTTTPTPSKVNVQPRQAGTSASNKAKAKGAQQRPLEPQTSTSSRPSVEANISPTEPAAKYANRLTEAKAMMTRVRYHLNTSRNTSGIIKKEVMEAAERLLKLVGEAEAEAKLSKDRERDLRSTSEGKRNSTPPIIADKEELIMASIERNRKLILENGKQMVELKKAIETQERSEPKPSYASAVLGGKTTATESHRRTLHSVAVTSQNDQETGEEVLERVRKAVEAKEGWVKVERVRKARDRKVIVGCGTPEDRERLKERIKKAGQCLVVEDMKNRDPLLVLKDVLIMHTDQEVVRALGNQNREVFGGLSGGDSRIAVKYRRKTRNPHTSHIVVAVSPAIWRRATEQGRLRIDLQNVVVEDQSPLVQCSRCLGYGHGRRFCKERVDVCSHCGGPHFGAECTIRAQGKAPTCINCSRARNTSADHNAFSRDCPVRRRRDDIARASIQYC